MKKDLFFRNFYSFIVVIFNLTLGLTISHSGEETSKISSSLSLSYNNSQEQVIIERIEKGGYVPYMKILTQKTPTFILYGDGKLIYKKSTEDKEKYMTTILKEEEVKKLITEIKELGFFEFDEENLEKRIESKSRYILMDLPSITITINLKEINKKVSIQGISFKSRKYPEIKEFKQIEKVDKLLTAFDHPEAHPYYPKRILLFAIEVIEGGNYPPWPIEEVDLESVLYEGFEGMILEESIAAKIIDKTYNREIFSYKGKNYRVLYRLLIPPYDTLPKENLPKLLYTPNSNKQ